MKATKDVVEHHLKSFGEGDLDRILSDYAPDAVLFTPEGSLKGRDAIRPLFVALLDEFGKPGATFSLSRQLVDGEHAYIVWTAQTAENLYELVTDTFFVRDGKIAVQSFAAKVVRRS